MESWNHAEIQEQLKRHEFFKYGDVDSCNREVRLGKTEYRDFHDEALAQAMIAFTLKTDAALENRGRFIRRLDELRAEVTSGRFDATGMYDEKTYRKAARAYITRLLVALEDNSRTPDFRTV
ncbi:MAG: hypothetical protein WA793_12730 [Sphingorhabdus sp.]|uniref:hypothetical protein n=1 Tax=Sphingomonadales TaxID=204457 RepID=UPI0032B880BA